MWGSFLTLWMILVITGTFASVLCFLLESESVLHLFGSWAAVLVFLFAPEGSPREWNLRAST
jgi:hypothetical protein